MKQNRRFLILTILLLLVVGFSQAQENTSYDQFKVLPREKVYVSLNTKLLFTGEYLYYKMYCLNDKTKQPSKISTIGYVELINENRESVFKHKIRLERSQGQGDFFVPTTVPSGNYKLIGYTQWMRNGSVNLFFQEDISIINPYQVNQDAILQDLKTTDTNGDSISTVVPSEDKRFVLTLDKENYSKKSKVNLGLRNFRGASGFGSYTVSVRKKEALKERNTNSVESYIEWHQKQAASVGTFYEEIPFPPELNGELLKGKLVAKDGVSSVAKKLISISIPGEDFQLKFVKTDSLGIFHVDIDKEYSVPYALFQVLDNDKGNFEIIMKENAPVDYSSLTFRKFHITSDMQDAIVERSVYNQIENGYFTVKPDTLRFDSRNDPYGGAYIEIVKLEEFTRFKTLDETIVELVPNVWTKKNKEGRKVFKTRSFDETYEESEFDALVYIDGVFIANHEDILDFDTRTVKTINTVREKYYLGGQYYFGMINIITNKGNYYDDVYANAVTKYEMDSPRRTKHYFNQEYTEDTNPRIPDFRKQLLWSPTIDLEGKEFDLSFYTSEVAGEYEIILEGFSIYGRPVVAVETFTVN